MINPNEQLTILESCIPGAGKGLFTRQPIKKGGYILEYTGTVTTWKEVDHQEFTNPYIFFVSRKQVINALDHPGSLGRYVNDARGLQRIKGIRNNAKYFVAEDKIVLEAIAHIPAGEEILAAYGKEYWDTIRANLQLAKKNAAKKIKSRRM